MRWATTFLPTDRAHADPAGAAGHGAHPGEQQAALGLDPGQDAPPGKAPDREAQAARQRQEAPGQPSARAGNGEDHDRAIVLGHPVARGGGRVEHR